MEFYDTIAAISTPIGEGGIGIIRVSGPNAESICRTCLRQPNGREWERIEERRVYLGMLVDEKGRRIDEAIFFLFKSPKSYTRDDLLEIQIHGSRVLLETGLKRVLEAGARLAEPGEFTKRAFLNGRIDLAQAEGVIDLIRARTLRGGKVAAEILSGELSARVRKIKDKLLGLIARIEAALDYPEEDLPPVERQSLIDSVQTLINELESLIVQSKAGKILREGMNVVLVGRPNVGKSSLLNALLQEERAIVTEHPGTTRDVIIEEIEVQGFPIRLIDTAGLRETDHPVEKMGMDRTRFWIDRADLLLLLLEHNSPVSPEDIKIAQEIRDKKFIVVINKTDQPAELTEEQLRLIADGRPAVYISAQNKEGLKDLEKEIFRSLGISDIEPEQEILVTRVRQRKALEDANKALKSALEGLQSGLSEDLIAVELHSALQGLNSLTGENADEELIEEIFNNFCIGK